MTNVDTELAANSPILSYKDAESLGEVSSVDTSSVIVAVSNVDLLRRMQVNRLVALQSSRPGQHLIGIVQRITRRLGRLAQSLNSVHIHTDEDADDLVDLEQNEVRVTLIGTIIDQEGTRTNVFRRTLETVPEINANCFPIEDTRLSNFMRVVTEISAVSSRRLSIGNYTLDPTAEAFLNGNKLFQRHAVIVGSTGSGKSWTTAQLVEQIQSLPNANAILFDVHGEYKPLQSNGISHFRIAGPSDLTDGADDDESTSVVFLPYWLLSYEDMLSMVLDRSDNNAPNQAMLLRREVIDEKRRVLQDQSRQDILDNFTIDSPVPYSMENVLARFRALNEEMVTGSTGRARQGEFHGRLGRFISRLENRMADRRLGFMFQPPDEAMKFDWLDDLAESLLAGSADHDPTGDGVKIIDFSEVPSDILPLVVSLVARIAFSIQQWTEREHQHPIALLCDEAHLYISQEVVGGSVHEASLRTFERIAKEGRKYGVGLVVISQRPAEVNRTVLSQCNNFIAMRLTNADDQSVVRHLLPESLGSFSDLLPILDTGEAIVVGDASLLPSRVRVREPISKPDSATVEFWDQWNSEGQVARLQESVLSWRRQSKV